MFAFPPFLAGARAVLVPSLPSVWRRGGRSPFRPDPPRPRHSGGARHPLDASFFGTRWTDTTARFPLFSFCCFEQLRDPSEHREALFFFRLPTRRSKACPLSPSSSLRWGFPIVTRPRRCSPSAEGQNGFSLSFSLESKEIIPPLFNHDLFLFE